MSKQRKYGGSTAVPWQIVLKSLLGCYLVSDLVQVTNSYALAQHMCF